MYTGKTPLTNGFRLVKIGIELGLNLMILPSIWVVANKTAGMFPKLGNCKYVEEFIVTGVIIYEIFWNMSTFAEPILVSGIVQVAKNQHELQIPSGLLGKWFNALMSQSQLQPIQSMPIPTLI